MRQMPGTAGRPDQGFARQSRVLPDALHARAAHPPREGDIEHLHQPGADRADGDRVHDGLRQAGPARAGRAEPGQGALSGAQTCAAAFSGAVLQRVRGDVEAAVRGRGESGASGTEDHRRPAAGALLSRAGRTACCSAPRRCRKRADMDAVVGGVRQERMIKKVRSHISQNEALLFEISFARQEGLSASRPRCSRCGCRGSARRRAMSATRSKAFPK